MATAQKRFKAHFDLSEAMIRLRSFRIQEALVAWKAILPADKQRTPLLSQLRNEQTKRESAERESLERQRAAVEASVEAKRLREENRRLKRMYAEMSMQNDLLKEALGKKR